MTGRTLVAYNAERGVDEDVYLACPGTDPLGILGYRGGAVLPAHQGVNDVVAQAPPPPPPLAAGQVCQGAPRKEGDASWPSLPPRSDGRPGDDRKLPLASHIGGPMPQRRRGGGCTRRVGSRIAGFSGSHQGVFGTPGARGDASPSTLAPQALPGAGSWADLIDADDAVAEKAAGLGVAVLWGSRRVAYGADIVGCPGADLPPHPEAVYTAIA